jgi:PKD repeat protein
VNTNLYLGFGAQSTTLQMCNLPSSGAPYTYAWSSSAGNRLNSTTAASPVFTPAGFGYYTFAVTVTNKYGCTSTANISICVTDIRVPGTNGAKVYVCHTPSGKNKTPQTLQVAISQVSSHLNTNSCNSDGNDRLGSCDQSPCNTPVANSIVGNTTKATSESSEETVTTDEDLKVTVMPNPTTTYFTLKLESRYETPISMRVMDARGRVIDAKSKIGANSTIQIGHNYSSGTYYAELIQGSKRKVVQMIKGRG